MTTQEKEALKLAAALRETADAVEHGNCNVSLSTVDFVLDLLTNRAIPQEEAQRILNMSRYSFEKAVEEGKIPAGRVQRVRPSRKVWFTWELRKLIRHN